MFEPALPVARAALWNPLPLCQHGKSAYVAHVSTDLPKTDKNTAEHVTLSRNEYHTSVAVQWKWFAAIACVRVTGNHMNGYQAHLPACTIQWMPLPPVDTPAPLTFLH
jgi:hypothetical protein